MNDFFTQPPEVLVPSFPSSCTSFSSSSSIEQHIPNEGEVIDVDGCGSSVLDVDGCGSSVLDVNGYESSMLDMDDCRPSTSKSSLKMM